MIPRFSHFTEGHPTAIHSIGLLLAPGRRDDNSVNRYLNEIFAPELRKHLPGGLVVVHPDDSFEGVASALNKLARKGVSLAFVAGPQCKRHISRYYRQFVGLKPTFVFFDALIQSDGSTYGAKGTRNLISPIHEISDIDVITFDLREDTITEVLGRFVNAYAQGKSKAESAHSLKVCFLGGANVPTVNKWKRGFRQTYDKSLIDLHMFDIGRGYSNFDNFHGAFALTQYVLEAYDPDLIIEVTGASCLGVYEAVKQASRPMTPAVVPFDYSLVPKRYDYAFKVPFSAVRNMEVWALRYLRKRGLIAELPDTPADEVMNSGTVYNHLPRSEVDSRAVKMSMTKLQEKFVSIQDVKL